MSPVHFSTIFFALISFWMYFIYKPFLMDMAVAVLLAISTASARVYFDKKFKNPVFSASLITAVLALLLFGPMAYFVITATQSVQSFDPKILEQTVHYIQSFINNFPDEVAIYKEEINRFLNDISYKDISKSLLSFITETGARGAGFIKDIFLILIFLFLFHMYGSRILGFFIKVIPFETEVIQNSFRHIGGTMSTVTYSIVVTALFEGTLFGVFMSALGYDGLLLGILYGFASLIPVIGGILMWLPLSVYELSLGHVDNAILIAAYTVVIISIIADTFVRPVIISLINRRINRVGEPQIHSLIIFFAIVAGLTAYGFWGAILGPGVTALFFSATDLLQKNGSGTKESKIENVSSNLE